MPARIILYRRRVRRRGLKNAHLHHGACIATQFFESSRKDNIASTCTVYLLYSDNRTHIIMPLLPGQRYATPTPGFGDRVFYETLFRQKPESVIAQNWQVQ
jgi:hypothetical protein